MKLSGSLKTTQLYMLKSDLSIMMLRALSYIRVFLFSLNIKI